MKCVMTFLFYPIKVRNRLIINSAQTKIFPCHRFSAKPAHRLSADSVFTHLCNPFVMSLPIVNTSQYQLVYALLQMSKDAIFILGKLCGVKYRSWNYPRLTRNVTVTRPNGYLIHLGLHIWIHKR